jgi:hypothetical protein
VRVGSPDGSFDTGGGFIRALAWLTVVACATQPVAGQLSTHRISGSAVCSACTIEKRLVGEITDRLLPGSLLDFGWVGVVRDGRFFVMSGWMGEELYVANPDAPVLTASPVAASPQECTIELSLEATLGPDLHDDDIRLATNVVAMPGGRFAVVNSVMDRIVVFGPAGRLERTVGRRGQGPGEFSGWVMPRASPDGRLHVFTPGRVHVFSAEGQLVRSTALAVQHTGFVQPLTDGYLVSGTLSRTGPAGVMHLLQEDGVHRRSFSSGLQFDPAICQGCGRPRWALSPDQKSVWIAQTNAYRLEHVPLDGGLRRELRPHDTSWLSTWNTEIRPSGGPSGERPTPRITSIAIDSAGLIWVAGYVAGRNWRPVRSTTGGLPTPGEVQNRLDAIRPGMAMVLDAVDPATGRVVARRTVEGAEMFLMQEGPYIWSRDTSPDGLTVIRIWKRSVNCPASLPDA